MKQSQVPAYTINNRIELIRGGRNYFDLLIKLIHQARQSIHLQTYIFAEDETGHRIAGALKAAADRGVEVYLLTDGYASQRLSHHFIRELREAGIHFRFFEPLLRSSHFYFGRRMHHKVMVADAEFALVGGINIADRYNDLAGRPAWLDFALYEQGEAARELCVLCWKTWNGFRANMGITPCEKEPPYPDGGSLPQCPVKMIRNDWVRHKNEISASYIHLLQHAHSHITILCSYFLPGKVIRRLLRNAAARGVNIRVIIAGRSDIMLAKSAERWMYDWLLRNRIELYEYQPAILHAKLATADDELMTIGSYNINNISAYASIELNMEIRDRGFVSGVQQTLDTIIQKDCVAITRESQKQSKNPLTQFCRWVSYQLIRTIIYLVTFYYKQHRN